MHSFMVSSGICPKGADFLGPLMLKKEDLVSGGARLNAENKNVYVGVSYTVLYFCMHLKFFLMQR